MASKDILNSPRLLSEAVKNWLAEHAYQSIELVENFKPENDEHADYKVLYEAQFRPPSLDKVYIEIWLAENGKLGVGIERYERVAKRMKIRSRKKQFVGGFEPSSCCSADDMFSILSLAAAGRFFIKVYSIPNICVLHLQLVIDHEGYLLFNNIFNDQLFWLKKKTSQDPVLGRLLTYDAWL